MSNSNIWYGDLIKLMAVAKTDEEFEGMAKACGFEKKIVIEKNKNIKEDDKDE